MTGRSKNSMAFIEVNFFSKSLFRITNFHIVLPNDVPDMMKQGNKHYEREMKTLYLLHGFSGNTLDWMLGSLAQDLAVKYNLAIVTPNGENSFYLDQKGTGRAYGTYIGEDLVEYVSKTFGLSSKKEDIFIGGLSMGGFGAIHTGLKYKDTFGGMFGLSSALIINKIIGKEQGYRDEVADFDYYEAVFGNLNELDESENNPEYLLKTRLANGETIQPIYMACGTEDFLINENREFHEVLLQNNVSHTYQESTGVHDWKFWNEYLEPAIVNMLEGNQED